MVRIERFIATRKRLRLSQMALSAGICTQATLSKFENHQQIPALDIMGALCARLGLTLNDIFTVSTAAPQVPSWPQVVVAFGYQNSDDFQRFSQAIDDHQLSLPAATDMALMRYFAAVCWQQDLVLAKRYIAVIDLNLASAMQQYTFYAITIHYYAKHHNDTLAQTTYHDLIKHQKDWYGAPYSVLKGAMLYLIAQYQLQTGNCPAAIMTAATGVAAAQKNDSTAFMENMFWIMCCAGEIWQQPDFVRQEVLQNARLLAKIHGNQTLIHQIHQIHQQGEKQHDHITN